ncbi:MAG: hypothetical protein ABGW78_10530 [Pirellulales bacterium]
MRRLRSVETELAGQDSFLDVVTNIVGILIILVMVIGGRVQQLIFEPSVVDQSSVRSLQYEIDGLRGQVALAENEVQDLVEQGEQLTLASMSVNEARIELATIVSAAQRELEEKNSDTDNARVRVAEFNLRKQKLKKEIEKTKLEAQGISHVPQTTEEVLAYPTPIGRTVTGEEIHFRLEGDKIAYIPLTELFERAKAQTRRQSGNISRMANRIETVGPEQNFTLDYVVETQIDRARGQVLVRSREWVVQPVARQVGEDIQDALAPESYFHTLLAHASPDMTVTCWCYPSSFEGFRKVREELYRLGIATACRPLPEGAPIGGSTEGSKSVAQ